MRIAWRFFPENIRMRYGDRCDGKVGAGLFDGIKGILKPETMDFLSKAILQVFPTGIDEKEPAR